MRSSVVPVLFPPLASIQLSDKMYKMLQREKMLLNFRAIAVFSWLKVFPFDFNLSTRKMSVPTSPLRKTSYIMWLYFAFLYSFYLSNCFLNSLSLFWNTKDSYKIPIVFITFLASVMAPTWNWKLFVFPKLQENIFNEFSFNRQGWLQKNILYYCTNFHRSLNKSRRLISGRPSMATQVPDNKTAGEKDKPGVKKLFLQNLPMFFCPILLAPTICFFSDVQIPFSWMNLVPVASRTSFAITICLVFDTSILLFWIATGYYFCLLTLSFLEYFDEEIRLLTNKLRFVNVPADALNEVIDALRVLRLKLQHFSQVTSYVTVTCKLLNVLLTIFCLHTCLQFIDSEVVVSLLSCILGLLSAAIYVALDKTLLMPLKMDKIKKRIVTLSRLHNKLTQKEIKVVVRSISSSELPVGQFLKFRRDSTPSYLSCIALQVIQLQSSL